MSRCLRCDHQAKTTTILKTGVTKASKEKKRHLEEHFILINSVGKYCNLYVPIQWGNTDAKGKFSFFFFPLQPCKHTLKTYYSSLACFLQNNSALHQLMLKAKISKLFFLLIICMEEAIRKELSPCVKKSKGFNVCEHLHIPEQKKKAT